MKRLLSILIMLLLCACAAGEEKAGGAEIYMVNVGKGDALIVRAGESHYLIDTAKKEQWVNVYRALKSMGVARLKGVFITHADKDHTGGLAALAASDIQVEHWYASAYCLEYALEEHPAFVAARSRGQQPELLKAGDCVDGIFRVVGPTRLSEDKEDNNSLAMILETEAGKAFFAGDMEYPEEYLVLSETEDVRADVFKVGNHGDDDTGGAWLIGLIAPKIALISTSSQEKPSTPDPMLLERLANAGAAVYVTEDSEAGIRVIMNADGIRAEYMRWEQAEREEGGASITNVNPVQDTIALAGAEVDLSGWFLYSDKGGETMVFAEGTLLSGTLIVGTRSTTEEFDVLWDDKNVVNDKKTDTISLYDARGRLVSEFTANP